MGVDKVQAAEAIFVSIVNEFGEGVAEIAKSLVLTAYVILHKNYAPKLWQDVYKVTQTVSNYPFFKQMEEYKIFLKEDEVDQIERYFSSLTAVPSQSEHKIFQNIYYFKHDPVNINTQKLSSIFNFFKVHYCHHLALNLQVHHLPRK